MKSAIVAAIITPYKQVIYVSSDKSSEEEVYAFSDKSSKEEGEDKEEIYDYNNSGYKSDNNGNSGVWSKSTSTVPNEVLRGVKLFECDITNRSTNNIPDEVLCGFESYDSDGINRGSSMNNRELCIYKIATVIVMHKIDTMNINANSE